MRLGSFIAAILAALVASRASALSWTGLTSPPDAGFLLELSSGVCLLGYNETISRAAACDQPFTPVTYSPSFRVVRSMVELASGRVLAGTGGNDPVDARIFYSDDEGMTWSEASPAPVGYVGAVLALLELPGGRVLASVQENSGGTAVGTHLFESTDDGATWTVLSHPPADSFTELVRLADGTLLAGALRPEAVFTSSDGGTSWSLCYATGGSDQVDGMLVTTSGAVVFGTQSTAAIHRSPDGSCDTYMQVAALPGVVSVTAMSQGDDGTLYAGASDAGIKRVFTSRNDGFTWTEDGVLPGGAGFVSFADVDLGGTCHIFTGTSEGLFQSDPVPCDPPAPLSWTGLTSPPVAGFLLELSSGVCLLGYNETISRAAACDQPFTPVTYSPSFRVVRSMVELASGRVLAGTGGNDPVSAGIFYSDDEGLTWSEVSPAPGGYAGSVVALLELPGGRVLASVQENSGGTAVGTHLFESTDDGATWTVLSHPPADSFTELVRLADGTLLAGALRPEAVFTSSDGGTSWSLCYATGGIDQVDGMLVTTSGAVVFGTQSTAEIHRSPDGSCDTYMQAAALPGVANVTAMLQGDDGTLYAGAGDAGIKRVFTSRNDGFTWTEDGVLPGGAGFVSFADVDLGGTCHIFTGTSEGLFQSDPVPCDAECADGVDNDGDGFSDLADPDCLDPNDASEAPACADGFDNDADNRIDFVGDPGCRDQASRREDPACDDDKDNDNDGGIDWDGGKDGAPSDPQCVVGWRTTEKEGSSCGVGFELAPLLVSLMWLLPRRRRSRR